MAEDFDHGPSGISANPAWLFVVPVPKDCFLRLSFQFNALWENCKGDDVCVFSRILTALLLSWESSRFA
jgi:hypothetical protein